ncbi:MAG: hypothetical protein V1922_05130 [bacterium]
MCNHLKKFVFLYVGVLMALVFFVFTLRFIFGGNEDSWICQNNKWIKHGNPSYAKPTDPCGKKQPIPKTKEECIKFEGVWKKQGPEPVETCNIKAADRGSICTDNSECEGWCQANITRDQVREGMMGKLNIKGRGQCSVWRVELGCFGMLEKGKIKVLCID